MGILKRIYIVLIILLFAANAYAACTDNGGGVWTTDGNESADVNECITAASAGDTINVIAGDGAATWGAGAVVIPGNKPINLIGPGSANLTVTVSGDYVITIEDYRGTLESPGARISGFKFFTTGGTPPAYRSISAKGTGWRIDNNYFESDHATNTGTQHIQATSTAEGVVPTGLIDNNTFKRGYVVSTAPRTFTLESGTWYADPGLGTIDHVYIEDNHYINDLTTTTMMAADSNRAGGYVLRYNTLDSTGTMSHSLQNPERTTRMWEIYGNRFNYGSYSGVTPIFMGAGVSVAFFNSMDSDFAYYIQLKNDRSTVTKPTVGACNGSSGWDGNLPIDNADYYGDVLTGSDTHTGADDSATLIDSSKSWVPDIFTPASSIRVGATITNTTAGKGWSCITTGNDGTTITCSLAEGQNWDFGDTYTISDGYPCRDQIGRGIDESHWTTYATLPGPVQTSLPSYFWQNRKDYSGALTDERVINGNLAHIKQNRDYYSMDDDGVRCGPLAAIPATCTTGQGYWATNQSCSDLTNMVGQTPATPISGSLYKCTATDTWSETAYYTPYKYPHPLRDEAAGDITAPTLSSATVDTNGTTFTMVFGENVVTTINTGFTITPSGGAATLTYASGTGTASLVYTISRTILDSETLTMGYTQPGNGIEDSAGNDLETISSGAVTNSSTQNNNAKSSAVYQSGCMSVIYQSGGMTGQ
jgi:hypothetical protein